MGALSVYVIVFMSAFLALYLPLQRKGLAEAFPKFAWLITPSAWLGSAGVLIFAVWLAILFNTSSTDGVIKAPPWSLWIGGPALALALCCVIVASYFQIQNISRQREKGQRRMKETQAELQRLDDELTALGIRMGQDKNAPSDGTK